MNKPMIFINPQSKVCIMHRDQFDLKNVVQIERVWFLRMNGNSNDDNYMLEYSQKLD